MYSLILQFHNFITAPVAHYFLHREGCPPFVSFGQSFHRFYLAWFIALLAGWSLLYFTFKTLARKFLRRMGLTVSRARRTAAALWCAGAGLGSALLAASQLDTSLWTLDTSFDPEATPPPPHVGMYLSVLATYLVHRLIAGCIRRGFTLQTFADLALVALGPATYLARWPELGFCALGLVSCAQILLELARLCWSIKKGLDLASSTFFYIYCLGWSCVYLIALPALLIAVATTPMESQEHRIGLALVFLSLTAHILVCFAFSPLGPAFRRCLFNCPYSEWLEGALFPGTDLDMLQMRKQAKVKRDSMEALAFARKNSLKRNVATTPTTENKKSCDAKALMQTVRCVTLLKRKIRARRERKAQDVAAQLESEETSSTLT